MAWSLLFSRGPFSFRVSQQIMLPEKRGLSAEGKRGHKRQQKSHDKQALATSDRKLAHSASTLTATARGVGPQQTVDLRPYT